MIESWLAHYDYDLPLEDAARDPELGERRRLLAGIGAGTRLDGGYYDTQALADILLGRAREENDGVPPGQSREADRLAELIENDTTGYQRALYRAVANVPSADAAADLCWLAGLMRQRADMYRPLQAMGVHPPLPYR